jgi:hypothetical protein
LRVASKTAERVRATIDAALGSDEQLLEYGPCWGASLKPRASLLLTGRAEYVVALTDRRLMVLVPPRRRDQSAKIVLAKRYDALTLDRVRRRRPMAQVVVVTSGGRMVLEFRSRQRPLARELVARMQPADALAATG